MLKVYKLDTQLCPTSRDMAQNNNQDEIEVHLDDEEDKENYNPSKSNKIAEKINCPGAVITGINTIALMTRMELYVNEKVWKSAS